MIILTKTQADNVRGLTKRNYALAPRPLMDGTFGLPEAVINDPQHSVHSSFLKSLPTRLINESEWEIDPIKTDLYDYKSNWQPGDKIVASATKGIK